MSGPGLFGGVGSSRPCCKCHHSKSPLSPVIGGAPASRSAEGDANGSEDGANWPGNSERAGVGA